MNELSRKLHSWRCPSVNTFKFQRSDHRNIDLHRNIHLRLIYMYMHKDISINIHIDIFKNTLKKHVDIHKNLRTCLNIYIHIYMHTDVDVCRYKHTCGSSVSESCTKSTVS